MSSGATDFEALLREALSPVEPPADLVHRLELTLVNLTELAQEELDGWELSAMRNPRNWVRPAAAALVGATAGTALVVLRVRTRHRARKQQSENLLQLAQHTLHDAAEDARRILPRRYPERLSPTDSVQTQWPCATAIPRVRRACRARHAAGRSAPTA